MMKLNFSLRPASKLKYSYKTKPYAHQKKALNKILKLDGHAALFMEMGTGKTKVAIDWAGIAFHNYDAKRVLVVAPLSVLGVWPRQIRQHSPVPHRIFRLEGATKHRIHLLQLLMRKPSTDDGLTWVIINYEGIWRESDRGPGVAALLIKWEPDLIIFDESHRLKSPTSKQSRAAYLITRAAPEAHRLVLTGTPITKAPLDAFGQFRVLDPRIFGVGDMRSDWANFKRKYGVWGGFRGFRLVRYKNLDRLIEKVRTWSYRVRKKDCFDLPEKVFLDVPVTLSDKGQKLYNKMRDEMIVELEEDVHAKASIVLTKLLRLSQITSGFVKDTEGVIHRIDDAKLKVCMDLLKDLVLEADHKVVVFVRFIADLQRIAEQLTNLKVGYRILDGSVPASKRDSFVEDFQTDPKVKVFIAQIQAGSEGIELTAASAAIYFSMSYSALNYWQSQDRLHRPGSEVHEKITYYRLVVPKSIDTITYQVLEQKGSLAKAVLHDPNILRP